MTEAAIDMKKVGLKHREMQVMRRAVWARGVVPNGHYLTTQTERASALRMVERGFLTLVDGGFTPPRPDWVVICLTKENAEALRTTSATNPIKPSSASAE